MRINFRSNYSEISKLLEAQVKPAKAPEGNAGFEHLLSNVSPDAPKRALNQPKTQFDAARINAGYDDPMASIRFKDAEPQSPLLDRLGKEFGDNLNQATSTQGVKTPTVLEVRRVPSSHSFDKQAKTVKIDEVRQLVENAGKKHGIDPALSMAVVSAESGFNPTAISSDGYASKGLFQLLDSTGNHLIKNSEFAKNKYDPFNPELNVDLGVGYLRYLHDIFSRKSDLPNALTTTAAANSSSLEKLAVAAFNAGEGRVAWAQNRATKEGMNPALYEQIKTYLPDSTQEYVDRVMNFKSNFEEQKKG